MKRAKKIALSGMLCALAVVIMMLGGLIPLATFCCPALAGLCLIPVFVEYGEKAGYCAYIAIAALSVILSPDKESALLFAFLGYYPVLKYRLDMLRGAAARIGVKLLIFNAAVAAMYALCIFVFRLDQVMRDYQEMNAVLLIATLALGNVTLILYDRMIAIMVKVYVHKFRGRFM